MKWQPSAVASSDVLRLAGRTRRRSSGLGLVAALLVTVSLNACAGSSGSPGPTARLFRTELPHLDQPPIPVLFSDNTGLVTVIMPQAEPSSDEHQPALLADPTDPTAFFISWLGGLCDQEVHLAFKAEPGGYSLHLDVQSSGSCPAAGISRGVRIVTSSAIRLSSILVTGRG